MKLEEQIMLEENELKPNKNSANIVLYSFFAMLIVVILNSAGVFHVHNTRMYICFFIVALCSLAIQAVRFFPKLIADPRTKYAILSLIFAEVLATTVALSQWTELLIAMPILLAMQYHTRKMTRFAIIGTFVIAVLAAPLSILLKLPQLNFYRFLVKSIGYSINGVSRIPDYSTWFYMVEGFKYISVPRCILIAAMIPISFYITDLASLNIKSRVDATYYSSTDIMTGLRNRFSFEAQVSRYRKKRPSDLCCIYVDADGLHDINNTFGHDAGDDLLKTCAASMSSAFGDLTYRIGGDEFVSFIENTSHEEIYYGIHTINETLQEKGYHVSIGSCFLEKDMTIDETIRNSENLMFAAKRKFHESEDKANASKS